MKYIKVNWLHNDSDEPVTIYSELSDENNELRKVEVFSKGHYGYASKEVTKGDTFLSLEPLPSLEEINKDTQFKANLISNKEFEELWRRALSE